MHEHLESIATPDEMRLVVTLDSRELDAREIASELAMNASESERLIDGAFSRCLVNRAASAQGDALRYTASDFYGRLSSLAIYDDWEGVPAEARQAVIDWDMAEFLEKHRPVVEAMERDPDTFHRLPNRDMLLLNEALDQAANATDLAVEICDCKAIMLACNHPREVCLCLNAGARLTLERGHGRRIDRDEAKRILVDADRAGLMHTGLRDWREHPEAQFAICNCCTCCCFPIRGGIAMNRARHWPRAHHVARRDPAICKPCGLCAKRCPFGAFRMAGKKEVVFDAGKCWGCGLCATGCPTEAIEMMPLKEKKQSHQ